MSTHAVQTWLRAEAAREAVGSVVFATGCGLVGLVVLAVTSVGLMVGATVVVAVLSAAAGGEPGGAIGWVVGIVVLGWVGLFLANARAARADVEVWRRREERSFGDHAQRDGVGPLGALLAYPGYESTSGWGWALLGPRLVHIAWAHIRRAWRLRCLDAVTAQRVMYVLLAKGKRLPLAEVVVRAELAEPVESLLALRDLPGVIFLAEPPPALTLSADYRAALGSIAGPLPALREVREESDRGAAAVRSLHQSLGLGSTAPHGRLEVAGRPRLRLRRPLRANALESETVPEDRRAGGGRARGRASGSGADQRRKRASDPRRVWEQHRPPKAET